MKNKIFEDFITIGIIIKNEERNIKDCLKSLVELNYSQKRYEIIVVDGNSRDKTKKISENFLKKSKIKYKIINEKDYGGKGHGFARNLVIKFSSKKSKYIAFTDGDCIVNRDWLRNLLLTLKKNDNSMIAGVGGPRYIKKTENKKEFIINSYLTSFIGSCFNPAFCKRKNIKFLKSIAGYNSLYKKKILLKYKYVNTYLTNCDDGEINFRISKDKYKFLYETKAKIYHSETNSLVNFFKNQINYGMGFVNMSILNKKLTRIFPLLLVCFFTYLFSLPILSFLLYFFNLNKFQILLFIPLLLYFFLIFILFFELLFKTKRFFLSFYSFILPALHHFGYFCGVIYNLFYKMEFKK